MNKEPGPKNPEVDPSRQTMQERGEKGAEGKTASEINAALETEIDAGYAQDIDAAYAQDIEQSYEQQAKEFATPEEIEAATAQGIESAEAELLELKNKIAIQKNLDPNNPEDRKAIDWIANEYQKRKLQQSAEARAKRIEKEPKVDREKLKANKGLKKVFLKVGAIALASALTIGAFLAFRNKSNGEGPEVQAPPVTLDQVYERDEVNLDSTEVKEAIANVGELSNGVTYDYREYADFENKTSKNAFGYDKSECFGNREATEDAIMDMVANKGPEYLGAYAYYMLTDSEKEELGIGGMSCKEIDDYMSNASNIDGGAKQRAIINKINEVVRDKENTDFEFYYENDTEYSYYIVFQDANGDNIMTPDELSLAASQVARNGSRQVRMHRKINNQRRPMIDLNMDCGLQPNIETAPDGIPVIVWNPPEAPSNPITPPNEVTPPEETPPDKETPPEETPPDEETPPEETPPDEETPPEETPPDEETPPEETPPDEDTPPEETPPEPGPTPEPKNLEAERENASPDVTPLDLDESVTPKTTLEQDQANLDAIREQQEADAAAQAEAERIRAEQAKAEEQAAIEAEQRRQDQEVARAAELAQMEENERQQREAAEAEATRLADEAAVAAAEQAASEQAIANAPVQEYIADETAREQARQQAEEEAPANDAESTSNAEATQEDRSNMFADGDF